MCIVCNCGEDGSEFLSAFESAKREMKRAATAMLKCSQVSVDVESKKPYDTTHKMMVRLIKDWNRLEQFRETGHGA